MLKDLAQPSHLIILAVIIIVLFGWKKLPDVTRSVGRSMRIFKAEVNEMKADGSSPSAAASDTVPGKAQPQTPPSATTPPEAQAPPAPTPPPAAPVDTPAPHDTTAR